VFFPQSSEPNIAAGSAFIWFSNDQSEATIDFESWLDGPAFEPLKAANYFRRFFVEGGTVVWPNGADIAPETLYEAARATRSNKALQPTADLPSIK
jgi:hypothetical protein